ncbi:hypothetical protein QL285_032922 [Trifolium repens]|nr:hypothetical protein QL285_032922 [Trifolium repens]KAK2422387.1 hypothetical protein QL285_032922 [Trifolium repens]
MGLLDVVFGGGMDPVVTANISSILLFIVLLDGLLEAGNPPMIDAMWGRLPLLFVVSPSLLLESSLSLLFLFETASTVFRVDSSFLGECLRLGDALRSLLECEPSPQRCLDSENKSSPNQVLGLMKMNRRLNRYLDSAE